MTTMFPAYAVNTIVFTVRNNITTRADLGVPSSKKCVAPGNTVKNHSKRYEGNVSFVDAVCAKIVSVKE